MISLRSGELSRSLLRDSRGRGWPHSIYGSSRMTRLPRGYTLT